VGAVSEPEELKLVESFDELRAGMLVVGKPCLSCSLSGNDASHRGIIIGPRPHVPLGVPCFEVLPKPQRHRGQHLVIAADAVDAGRVYRVVIPPAADSEQRAASTPVTRKREHAR